MPQALGFALLAAVTAIVGPVAATTASAIIGTGGLALFVGVGVGLTLLASFLFQPRQLKPSDGQTIIKQSAAPRRRSYGRVKVGGVLLFANVKDAFLHRVVAMGSGEIDAVEQHWIDDVQITLDGSGNVTTSKYVRNSLPRVHIQTRLGTDSPTVYSGLSSDFPSLWTSNHLGKGIPHAYVRLRQVDAERIMDMFPRLAETAYRQVQRGAKVPNVSGGALTAPSWSDNAARVILDYLIHPDGLGLDPSWIENEIASWATAIAACNDAIPLKAGGTEPRYRIWNTYRFDERPADVLGRYLRACDAQLYPTPNRGLAIRVGKWTAPTVTVDDDAVSAFTEIGRGRDILTTANTVRAQFTSPNHDYQETDAQPWIDHDDVADRGVHAMDIELYSVPSHAQCRRLMKLAALRANPEWVGTLTCNKRALPCLGERFITVTLSELGIDDTFEIVGSPRFIIEDGTIVKGLQIDVQSLPVWAYNWDAETEEGTGPDEPDDIVPISDLPVPTGFDVVVSSGVATLSWNAPPDDSLTVEARGKLTSGSVWTSIPVSTGATETTFGPLADDEYEFQIRHRSLSTGRVSDWTSSIIRESVADPTAPGPVVGLDATVDGSDVTIAWTLPNSANVVKAFVYRHTVNNFGASTQIATKHGTANQAQSHLDSGLGAASYYYWVTAVNGSNVESTESATGEVVVS